MSKKPRSESESIFTGTQVAEALSFLDKDAQARVIGNLAISQQSQEQVAVNNDQLVDALCITSYLYREAHGRRAYDRSYLSSSHCRPFMERMEEHPELLHNPTYHSVVDLIGIFRVINYSHYFSDHSDQTFLQLEEDGMLWQTISPESALGHINRGYSDAWRLGSRAHAYPNLKTPFHFDSLDDFLNAYPNLGQRREMFRPILASVVDDFTSLGINIDFDPEQYDDKGYGTSFDVDQIGSLPEQSVMRSSGGSSESVTIDYRGHDTYLDYAVAALAWLDQDSNRSIDDFAADNRTPIEYPVGL